MPCGREEGRPQSLAATGRPVRIICWHNFEHNRYAEASSIMPA